MLNNKSGFHIDLIDFSKRRKKNPCKGCCYHVPMLDICDLPGFQKATGGYCVHFDRNHRQMQDKYVYVLQLIKMVRDSRRRGWKWKTKK
jgi:hypothetical protein